MKALFWKEWREFAVAAALFALLAAFLGLPPKFESRLIAVPLFAIHGTIGVLAGAWHAFLDRRAMGDAFLRHRPVVAWRMHAARSAAGLVVVTGLSLVSLATTLLVPYGHGLFASLSESERGRDGLWSDYSHGVPVFAVLLAVAAWAAVRLGASMGNRFGALVLGAAFPALLALSLSGTVSNVAAFALAVVAAGAAACLVVVRQASGVAAGGSR